MSSSLYRRHRPQTLDQVVGQQHVVQTLRNAIEQDKVNHAYLFVGSRGTGKTSIAKILAKSLNCVNGPTTTPCGKCQQCQAIARGSSLDVVEIDAASHNSVDDIRELREAVNFAPAEGSWKVYILDEAHMLSNAAWNAFLKTLEEPPSRTIFVLATTEVQKVMATIIDRCQRFDFRRPSIEQIEQVLARVVEAEKIGIDAEALKTIARSANGSFRDAISTLDQLVTFCGSQISSEQVVELLGVADSEQLFKTTTALITASPSEALAAVAAVVDSGTELTQFIRDLILHLRNLFVTQAIGEVSETLALSDEASRQLLEQAKQLPTELTLSAVELFTAALTNIKNGADARTQLELALVKAARSGEPKTEDRPPVRVKEEEPEQELEPAGEATLDAVQQALPRLIEELHKQENGGLLGGLLAEARLIELERGVLKLAYAEPLLKRKAEASDVRAKLEDALTEKLGQRLSLIFELDQEPRVEETALDEQEMVELIKREFDAIEVNE